MGNELRDCRGSVLMETVIVMPVLLLLIFGVIQFAHIWTARQMVAYAAFCATRAAMVVPPGEQEKTALNAAEVALSWMNMADGDQDENTVKIPGWGEVVGSACSRDRVAVKVEKGGEGDEEVAQVEVTFKFPLLIPVMAVNRIFAKGAKQASILLSDTSKANFYEDLVSASERMGEGEIGGWPYIKLTETCVLPMPYSTKDFPIGAFDGVDIRRGES